jgi:hypothetical protein
LGRGVSADGATHATRVSKNSSYSPSPPPSIWMLVLNGCPRKRPRSDKPLTSSGRMNASATAELSSRTSLTTSALSRDTISVQAAGAGSQKPRVGGGGRASIVGQRFPVVHASTLACVSHISDGVAHQTSLRSRRTMMIYANSLRWEAGRLFILPVTARWTTSVRRHSRIQALPRRRL